VALNIGEKKDVVKEISNIASSAQSAVAAEYRGLTVQELSKLRDNARDLGVYVKVVKNSLAKIAIKDTNFECMDSSLKGPLIFAFSKEDLGSAAKLVHDFKKDNKLLKPVVVAVNGELVDVEKLSQIAALPSKDQAISMLMAVMKLPIEKLARTLAAPNVKLVQTLSAYKIKLEQN
jgi:large subunit ribosomal protein L10